MKNKIATYVFAAACAAVMASCGSSRSAVDYREADHYFVRNDVTDYAPRLVTTQQEFDSLFGAAAVMGSDGLPTEIDFARHNVVALIEPQTNIDTDIKVKSVKKSGDRLTVTYQVRQSGSPRSYTTVPALLLRIDKKYGNNVCFVKE